LEFTKKVPNKKVLYEFFKNRCQKYVPCQRDFSIWFAKEILAGRKKLLDLRKVVWIDSVPNWKELSTTKIWKEVLTKYPGVNEYFPRFSKSRLPEKSYLLNVMNTVVPNSIIKVVQELKH